jgi:hypothetical protein
MSNTSVRSLIVIAVLLVGVIVVYAPSLLSNTQQEVNAAADQFTYVSDLDFWQRTPRETTVRAKTRVDLDADLHNIPTQIGDWESTFVPETNREVLILLEPEQYVRRLYINDEERYLWLSVIGGRNSQPFHAPDICYDADGWQYNLNSHAIELDGGGEIYGLWLEAQKSMSEDDVKREHIVFYFYLFPKDDRELSDGIVLFKLTSTKYGTAEETLAVHADFVRELFTSAR